MATGPTSSNEDDALFQRARDGDAAAWDELFRKCYPKVIRVVRRKLNTPMRSAFDSTDFASEVMKSLAANMRRLDFSNFQSLMGFLQRVAEQKVIDEHRKATTQKRDITRVQALDVFDPEDGRTLAVAAPDPTPSQVALAEEVHEQLLSGQSEPGRAVIAMKEQGYTCPEIAEQIGWNLRKVQRFFKGLEESYQRAAHAH